MAEFLIKAQGNLWMENLAKENWASKGLTQRTFDARGQIGDIIVVKPDGWVWGNKECLPSFVVVKLSGMTEEEAKKYEETLMQDEVITRQGTIDKKEWEDETKQVKFIQSNRFTEIPTVIETKEIERIVVTPISEITEASAQFKTMPQDVSSTQENLKIGMVVLKGIVDVNTVEGQAINTYLLRKRKYQIDPKLIDGKLDIIEVKDLSELNMNIKNNTPITETVWQVKNG